MRLSDLTLVDTLGVTGGDGFTSSVIDSSNGYAYFGMYSGKVMKVRLSDFSIVETLTLEPGEDRLYSAAIDSANGYAYFAKDYDYRVVKIRLSDFTRVGALGSRGDGGEGAAVIDPERGYAYLGTHTDPGKVIRIDLGNTRTSLTSSANPSASGQSVQFTAMVAPVVPNSGTPSGSVQFQVDGTNLGSAVSLSGGSAMSPAVSNLAMGTHTITALYFGPNGSWNDSQATLTQTVGKATTTTFISSQPSPSAEGQEISVEFTITPDSAAGIVTVSDGSSECASVAPRGNCALTLFNPETKTLTATYPGDANHSASTGTASHTLTNLVPVLATLGHPSSTAGGPTFTLTVTGDKFIPGTTIQWNGSARTTTFVSRTLLTAAIPASDLALPGTIQITVKHPGRNGDTSNALTHTISWPTQGFPLYLPLIAR